MAWMETDYSKHTHFRWKIKWRLEHLGALGFMGETTPLCCVVIVLLVSSVTGMCSNLLGNRSDLRWFPRCRRLQEYENVMSSVTFLEQFQRRLLTTVLRPDDSTQEIRNIRESLRLQGQHRARYQTNTENITYKRLLHDILTVDALAMTVSDPMTVSVMANFGSGRVKSIDDSIGHSVGESVSSSVSESVSQSVTSSVTETVRDSVTNSVTDSVTKSLSSGLSNVLGVTAASGGTSSSTGRTTSGMSLSLVC